MPDLDCPKKNSKNNWFFNELKYNIISTLKITSLLIGYSIFLFYFIQNDFFPNMDIFNWGSLIISAFILGSLWFFILISFIIVVSYCWSNFVVKDKILLKKIAHKKGDWLLDDLYLRKITIYCFWIPLLINNLLLVLIGYAFKNAYVITSVFILMPIILGGITASTLWKKLQLPYKRCLEYFMMITYSIFISSVFCIIFSYIFQDNISHLNEIIFLFFIFITTMFINIITVLFIEKNKLGVFMIIISFFYFLFFLTNIGKSFPAKVVKTLNIGNYQASQVYLTSESCQRLQETQLLEISPQCSVENIEVLWDIGGRYIFKVAVNGEQEILSLDAKEIVAVLKSKKPSTACRTQPPEAPVDNSISQ
ncbi:hypothetical protein [unidentified bacterial endosymbiont]|uniref:hypothetical protein n=1 Tax=unidentified bacterial endosymbiont TaxID=2355 RepID=UPI00209D383F|nr:hypothetical protein [unidentified bacterial endosymbiont]